MISKYIYIYIYNKLKYSSSRRKALKLGIVGSLGTLGLSSGASTEAVAVSSEPEDQWSDDMDSQDSTPSDDGRLGLAGQIAEDSF